MTDQEFKNLYAEAKAERDVNFKIVEDYMKELTSFPIHCRVDSLVCSKYARYSVEVNFLDAAGKEEFGADFRLVYDADYCWSDEDYKAPTLRMDTGSLGTVDREEHPGRWAQFEMMGEVVRHHDALCDLFRTMSVEKQRAFLAEQDVRDKAADEKERLEQEAKQAAIEAAVKVGYTFSCTEKHGENDTTDYTYTITKITPKRIYMEQTAHRDFITYWKEHKIIDDKISGYYDRERLVSHLLHFADQSIELQGVNHIY